MGVVAVEVVGLSIFLTGMLAGLAIGQVLVGPLSDAVGRRKPLLVGSALHVIASLVCLLTSNIVVLDIARVFQGLGGASAGEVLAMAVVRDLFSGYSAQLCSA